jgi:asparagine synthase (glutamine-hydrolysing)
LKTYDGREKSLLRGATRDVLPESVVNRVDSPYPSTSDPQYGAAIQAHAKDLFGSGDDALFSLIDSAALASHRSGPAPARAGRTDRIERVLDLAVWIDMYKPTIVF